MIPRGNFIGDATTTSAGLMSAADKALVNLLNSGSGSPEGVVTATVGDVYMDTTNGKLYLKVSGTGNTGWREVSPSVSGTYTPTTTATLNLDSNPTVNGLFAYERIITGSTDIVIGGGSLSVDPTAAGTIQARISLPVSSNFASTYDAWGVCSGGGNTGVIYADVANDTLFFSSANTVTTAFDVRFTFGYRASLV